MTKSMILGAAALGFTASGKATKASIGRKKSSTSKKGTKLPRGWAK